MPFRTFRCGVCGVLAEDLQDLDETFNPPCSECGGATTRNYAAEGRAFRTRTFETPILMYSIAPSPDEIPAFRKACPDVDLTDLGVPIARNRPEKLRILKHFGHQEMN